MNVGILIARFQTDALHEGHRQLFSYVLSRHEKVLVFLGCAPHIGTKYNPLDYPTRERMVKREFPGVIVLPIMDNASDEAWSKQIDYLIRLTFPNVKQAYLYGGRDSFIPHYKGQFKTFEVQELGTEYNNHYKSTDRRTVLGQIVGDTSDFRHGVIYAIENYSFPHVRLAVDFAMTRVSETWKGNNKEVSATTFTEIVMGRKPNETGWRLPGGMVDPEDETPDEAAKRELMEETGLVCEGGMSLVKVMKVHDWRNKRSPEKGVMTCIYHAPYSHGAPRAADDLSEARWVHLSEAIELAIPDHKPLVAEVIKFLNKNKKE